MPCLWVQKRIQGFERGCFSLSQYSPLSLLVASPSRTIAHRASKICSGSAFRSVPYRSHSSLPRPPRWCGHGGIAATPLCPSRSDMSLGVRLTASTQTDRDLRDNWDRRKSGRQKTADKASRRRSSAASGRVYFRRNEAVGVLSHERLIARNSNAGNSVPGLVIGSSRLCSRFARTQTLTLLATDGVEVLLDAVQPDSVHGRVGRHAKTPSRSQGDRVQRNVCIALARRLFLYVRLDRLLGFFLRVFMAGNAAYWNAGKRSLKIILSKGQIRHQQIVWYILVAVQNLLCDPER